MNDFRVWLDLLMHAGLSRCVFSTKSKKDDKQNGSASVLSFWLALPKPNFFSLTEKSE